MPIGGCHGDRLSPSRPNAGNGSGLSLRMASAAVRCRCIPFQLVSGPAGESVIDHRAGLQDLPGPPKRGIEAHGSVDAEWLEVCGKRADHRPLTPGPIEQIHWDLPPFRSNRPIRASHSRRADFVIPVHLTSKQITTGGVPTWTKVPFWDPSPPVEVRPEDDRDVPRKGGPARLGYRTCDPAPIGTRSSRRASGWPILRVREDRGPRGVPTRQRRARQMGT